jgi:thymidylate kinase
MASDIEGNRNQLARTMSQLAEAGFRPVWSREHGYPGTIPEDIGEYIDSNSHRTYADLYLFLAKARGYFY